jgi:transcriptional regulator with XRE-family HTH domain
MAELRGERGLTQQRVADQLGVTAQYVQAVEGGRVNLSIRALVDWANLLHAAVAAFLEPPRSRAVRRGRPPMTDGPRAARRGARRRQ